jgi:hypothetical protein
MGKGILYGALINANQVVGADPRRLHVVGAESVPTPLNLLPDSALTIFTGPKANRYR